MKSKNEIARIAIEEAEKRLETINAILKAVNDEYEAEKEVLRAAIEKNNNYLDQNFLAIMKES